MQPPWYSGLQRQMKTKDDANSKIKLCRVGLLAVTQRMHTASRAPARAQNTVSRSAHHHPFPPTPKVRLPQRGKLCTKTGALHSSEEARAARGNDQRAAITPGRERSFRATAELQSRGCRR